MEFDFVGSGYASDQSFQLMTGSGRGLSGNMNELSDSGLMYTGLKLRATAEDMLLLLHHDAKEDRSRKLSTIFLRLTMNPIESPHGAAVFESRDLMMRLLSNRETVERQTMNPMHKT